MAEDLKFKIGSYIDSTFKENDTVKQSIVLKAVQAGTNAPVQVYPITRADKVRGLQTILDDIASKINTAQNAATTSISVAKDAQNKDVLTLSTTKLGDESLNYTLGLPQFAIGSDFRETSNLYKFTTDVYGRVTAVSKATGADVLGLNIATADGGTEATRVASEDWARTTAKSLTTLVQSADNDADGALAISFANTADKTQPTQYTVNLKDIGAAYKPNVIIGTEIENEKVVDKYGPGAGLAKIEVDKFGRVVRAVVPTQADIIALTPGAKGDSETLVTRNDVNWIGNQMQSLLQNTNAMQYQGIILSLYHEKFTETVISDTLKTANGGNNSGAVKAKPGDTFMVGVEITPAAVGTNIKIYPEGVTIEPGDMIVCTTPKAENGSTAAETSFYVIQKNIDGAVTTSDGAFGTDNIVVGIGTSKAVTSKSASDLNIAQVTEDLKTNGAANEILIFGGNNSIDGSGINLTELQHALEIGSNFENAVNAGTKNQVLTKTDSGYEFKDIHNDGKLSNNGTTVKFTVTDTAGTSKDAGAVEFKAGTAITLQSGSGTITVTHDDVYADAGAAGIVATASTGTIANGGQVVIPNVTVNAQGHVTALSTSAINLPEYSGTAGQITLTTNAFALATVTLTTAVGTGAVSQTAASDFTAVTGVTTDEFGRVTGVNSTKFTVPALNTVKVATSGTGVTYNLTGVDTAGDTKTLNANDNLTLNIGTDGKVTFKIGTGAGSSTIKDGVFSGKASGVTHKLTVGTVAVFDGTTDVAINFGTGVELTSDKVIALSTVDLGEISTNLVISTDVEISGVVTSGTAVLSNGGPLSIPKLTIDEYGRVRKVETEEIELAKTFVTVGATTFIAPDATVEVGGAQTTGINIPFGTGIEVHDNVICGALTYDFVEE